MDLFFWLFLSLVMAGVTAAIASGKGRSGFGFFVYALLVWPVAFLHALLASPAAKAQAERREAVAAAEGRRGCPFCAEWILPQAAVCPFCRRNLPEDWAGEETAQR